ncbi:cupin domain-containing protein [Microbacterium sp. SYP-A9085]|uniref:cupin domain-containing protein n=1 Tax=Microbacterium sp. SYP-A9085 TaxID=2664454 RepID=UPI00129AC784|nr:cupin domain-containing protein [Microbacterium sp. SYP-A9085]MRH28394.1 cupin domain-containing protein [Microbacterium sp. SYP-A9085]
MSGYDVIQVGAPSSWTDPGGAPTAKRFVDKEIPTQFIGTSVNAAEPGAQSAFWHAHERLEELYVFLAGRGQMALDEDVIDVQAGTVVRVGQGVMRAWHALPDSPEPLRWLCVRSGGDTLADIGRDSRFDKERPRPW